MALQRLFKELKFIKANPVYGCTADQDGEDPFRWKATLQGPKESLYEVGTWNLVILFPTDYPFHPPNVAFKTRIFHPNINDGGGICAHFLLGEWSPEMNINKVLLSLCSLLCEPNPDSALNHHAAATSNRRAYDQKVREMTQQFAMTPW